VGVKQRIKSEFAFAELSEVAERDDFGEILTSADVPDTPNPEKDEEAEKWSDGGKIRRRRVTCPMSRVNDAA
jgi:hypothetical protein